jgi:hypothetical protein
MELLQYLGEVALMWLLLGACTLGGARRSGRIRGTKRAEINRRLARLRASRMTRDEVITNLAAIGATI